MTALFQEFHFTRFSFAGVLSLILTFLLFFAMQSLVEFDGTIEPTVITPDYVPFIKVKEPEAKRERERIRKPELKDPPPIPPIEDKLTRGISVNPGSYGGTRIGPIEFTDRAAQ